MLYKELTINIPGGLKSKGAAMMTHVAGHFESQILIESEYKKINAKSIMGVLSLQVPEGDTINIVANGKDEKEAIAALEKLASTGSIPSEIL
ncbi:MAG: HPr family phosphocarrier protein [Clostridia bacterium]|nr:HPr family phosphocarrier protein [Clostridia bacterium]MBR3295867.1 HPr family phosphocarrier protein [Clostridia bacterium]